MSNKYCIIMAGGIGSRFWPMSRSAHPKQFLDILGTGRTLLQLTYDRFLNICPQENIYVVTNENYVGLVKKQLPELATNQVLGEPIRRNTAPCIAYAIYKIEQINAEANIVVAPSDHIITKSDAFTKAINNALDFTEEVDGLVTLGIQPDRAETGYGYIQFIEESCDIRKICKVKTFTEKPNLDMAKFFLQSGEFLWNAGIFIWKLKTIKSAFQKYLPEIHHIFSDGSKSYNTPSENEFIKKAYALCTNISIDYGIMEKADNVHVLVSDFGWSDLGTWGSLYNHIEKDENANAIVSKKVLSYDTKDCIVNVPENKLVVMQGLEGYIVVESDNILLICKKEDEQQIRHFVNDVRIKYGDKFL
jgi:mannose-1-phosphate guanylyltransferase